MRPWLPLAALIAGVVGAGCGNSSPGHAVTLATTEPDAGMPGQDAGPGPTPGGADAASLGDTGAGKPDAGMSSGENSVPIIVNAGPPGAASSDVPFISVTLCVPGTSNCQTIDYVSVDTGSTGLRVISSVLQAGLTFPQQTVGGSPLTECYTYADGYVWGSVRLADVKIGGEVAARVPIHILGDPAFPTVPSDCSSSGPSEDTVMDFGANAIIGVGQMIADCGDACATSPQPTTYYTCSGGSCTAASVPVAQQVTDPVGLFPTDNDGVILQFPSVPPASGAATLTGTLVLGIGTAPNNGLGSAKVLTLDDNGLFTTTFNGATLSTSFIDSGSSSYSFNDSSLPTCADMTWAFCPTATQSFTAQNQGQNGVTTSISFTVANADTLFNANGTYAAFDDIAGPWGLDDTTFDWGFPFFMGRSVFVGFAEGGSMPNGYVAY